jgi:holo-[acyl-carrier protein] synthase
LVVGVGVDLVEVERIAQMARKWDERFLVRIFTAGEIRRCRQRATSAECFAVRFAAKEALAKALGHGWCRHFKWTDIEVVNDESGQPNFAISGITQKLIKNRMVKLSLSHTKSYAIAVAVVEDVR